MFTTRRLRVFVAVMFVVSAAGLAITVMSSSAAPSVVRLHLASNGRYFQFGTTTQTLTTANCQQCIDGFDTGIQGHTHRIALHGIQGLAV